MLTSDAGIPFIWTVKRHRLWNYGCRREYFYHYYAGWGGHEPSVAEKETEALHLCRNLLDPAGYRRRLLYRMIRGFFCNGLTEDEEAQDGTPPPETPRTFPLKSTVIPVFDREWRSMLLGEAAADHRKPLLAAVMEPERLLLSELKEKISSALLYEAELLENSLCRKLCAIPFAQRRFLSSPLFFSVGELSCCTVPLAAWVEKGRLTVIECRSDPAPEEEEAISLLYRYYGMNIAGYPPERVVPAVVDFTTGRLREISSSSGSSAALRMIRSGTDAMIRVHAAGCAGKAEAFPASPSEKCLRCRFRSFCVK